MKRITHLVTATVAACLLLAAGRGIRAAETSSVALDYELWAGGLHALTFETKLTSKAPLYQVDLAVRTEGVIGRMFPFTMQARTLGEKKLDGLRPQRFGSRARWKGNDRRVTLRYGADGSLTTEVVPPPEDDNRDPVPQAQRRGTLDPMSAILAMIEATSQTGQCSARIPVFDGRRRYDMVLRHIGPAEIKPTSYSVYAGPVTECRAGFERVAGFWNNRRFQECRLNEVRVFIAPVLDGAPPVPVRVEAKNDYLAVRAHLVNARFEPSAAIDPASDF